MSAITSPYSPSPLSEWQGSRPQKFKGGRKHNNHPPDELDHLLMGSLNHSRLLGPSKKRFQQVMTIGTDEPPRPHIRPNLDRTGSNIVFDCENAPNLFKIKAPFITPNQERIPLRAGESKWQNYQKRGLQTGIYGSQLKPEIKNLL